MIHRTRGSFIEHTNTHAQPEWGGIFHSSVNRKYRAKIRAADLISPCLATSSHRSFWRRQRNARAVCRIENELGCRDLCLELVVVGPLGSPPRKFARGEDYAQANDFPLARPIASLESATEQSKPPAVTGVPFHARSRASRIKKVPKNLFYSVKH